MQFAAGPSQQRMIDEWATIHPDLRSLLEEFEKFSQTESMPAPVITQLVRTVQEEREIYVPYFHKIVHALAVDLPLSPSERQLAQDLRGKTEAELEAEAHKRFSWHLVRCASDLRIRHYSIGELAKAADFFKAHCVRPMWEFLVHDVTAPHMHVGRRDFSWRAKLDPPTRLDPVLAKATP